MARRTKQEYVTFASLPDAMEAERKARQKLIELRQFHLHHATLSYDLLLIIVNITEKRCGSDYLSNWLSVNYEGDVKDFIRCLRVLDGCERYYKEHGLDAPRPALHFDGRFIDGVID